MRIFKVKDFAKWARKEGITNSVLKDSIKEMENGLIDAALGGDVYKKRIPIPGQGKSGSTRSIIAFKLEDKAFFMLGFAKSDKDNIGKEELKALKILASQLLNYSELELEKSIKNKILIEVE